MTLTGSYALNHNRFPARTSTEVSERARARIRTGIWIYFLLLIFEGALRKWVLPSLAGPLLIVRDPLALWIVVAAWNRGYLDMKHYAVLVLIGFIGIYTAFFLGHGNLIVAVFGARIFMLHIPLIFVIGKILNKQDLLKIARSVVIITIPMTMLIIVQFYSPQTAWVNIGVGGEGGAGFSGAMNFYRPPGTFSFTNGNTLFYDLSACFVVYFWFNIKEINKIILIVSSIALVLAVPLSMSRGLLFQVIITLLFAVASILWKPKYLGGLVLAVLAVVGVLAALSFTPYFTTATAAFYSRFESANTIEGGIDGVFLDRFLGGMIEAISLSSRQPFFGYGIGMGTNVGSTLLSGGRYFLLSEGEWGRVIGELGPVFGLIVIFLRLKLALSILYRSLWKLKEGILMPWILASCGLLSVAQAGWAQPTSLGFCVLLTGLILASLNERKNEADLIGSL